MGCWKWAAATAEKELSRPRSSTDTISPGHRPRTHRPRLSEVRRGGPRADADRIDAGLAAGEPLPPRGGVATAIKQPLHQGMVVRTTCPALSSWKLCSALRNPPSPTLWQAGAVLLGKPNLDEFAMGSSTRLPFAPAESLGPERVPGRSSGAVRAVAAVKRCSPGSEPRLDPPARSFLRA